MAYITYNGDTASILQPQISTDGATELVGFKWNVGAGQEQFDSAISEMPLNHLFRVIHDTMNPADTNPTDTNNLDRTIYWGLSQDTTMADTTGINLPYNKGKAINSKADSSESPGDAFAEFRVDNSLNRCTHIPIDTQDSANADTVVFVNFWYVDTDNTDAATDLAVTRDESFNMVYLGYIRYQINATLADGNVVVTSSGVVQNATLESQTDGLVLEFSWATLFAHGSTNITTSVGFDSGTDFNLQNIVSNSNKVCVGSGQTVDVVVGDSVVRENFELAYNLNADNADTTEQVIFERAANNNLNDTNHTYDPDNQTQTNFYLYNLRLDDCKNSLAAVNLFMEKVHYQKSTETITFTLPRVNLLTTQEDDDVGMRRDPAHTRWEVLEAVSNNTGNAIPFGFKIYADVNNNDTTDATVLRSSRSGGIQNGAISLKSTAKYSGLKPKTAAGLAVAGVLALKLASRR
uniref:Uncharacterized protein n=1 Tax=Megaviridae environmental sample TaxID=1737588 RepID=A0A5J6VI69_9VIRU|nr:MAG: hypothetical protein [Megaviridae environmental sample]